jgi:hypothetical protein
LEQTVDVWTSGTNDGVNCPPGKYGWCPSGKPDDESVVKLAKGDGSEKGLYLRLTTKMDTTIFKDNPLTTKMKYVCEVYSS